MKKIIAVTLLILIIDQASKLYIKTHFHLGESVDVFSWFKLAFVENPGMAYGLHFGGAIGKYALSLVRIALVIGIIVMFKKWLREGASNYLIIPMAMIFAGAIGNLIDGMFYGLLFDTGTVFESSIGRWIGYDGISKIGAGSGYASFMNGCVVDMLYFPLFKFNWPSWIPGIGGTEFEFFRPVFNIADSAITVGAIIILIFKKKAFPNGLNF
ncbi:lipoprotein signal peptidase [Elizabethkingia meningoseptica]|uniref:Lipoprotein signal peptidase n=1 Tax=Elizabethkingia meningoseptica TaxID=238 RepID=A0A1V3TZ18_ELIME|nr:MULTISPECIES: lipoprotein signal peptidase [Elizabethkingia]AQX04155.1 lipoprotein signal peptidase [Elizabethkingia meningoseptica]AQX11615.1 lipoprotein signal peptidase [Elizabethkingia meningoseptica]AQX46196.1 peptidase A8 [Elizabethkingia meningoseptica]EJK5330344.1 lipoprotein signal peptidase [Elizabethkingia meningoseptica]EOR30710.1 lipoprotein signal peptidase [Elizabethkingia meningoseptica ATCC 13253 = NBRC 12535]